MIGSFSPDEGMVRISIADDSVAARLSIGQTNAAVVPPITFAAWRLVTIHCRAFDSLAPARSPRSGFPSISLRSRWLGSVNSESFRDLAQMPYNSYMAV
jgi:hypothetical protein